MNGYRRQHYVPVFYMKNFSCDGRNVSVFQIDKDKEINRASIKHQCQENYFYGDDLSLEHQYQELEAKWSTVIQKAIKDEKLNSNDKSIIKEFALFQRSRTKNTALYRREQSKQAVKEWCKSTALSHGIDPESNKEFIEDFANRKAEELASPVEIINMTRDIKPYMDDLDVGVIKYNTRAKLIASDTPVIMKNPIYKFRGDGIGAIGIVLFFPISPDRLVYIFDSLAYKQPGLIDGIIVSNDDHEVRVLNTYQYISAENIVFSNSTDHFYDVLPDYKEAREITKNQDSISVLGTETEKLVAMSERSIWYNEELSFCKEPREFRRIPKECKGPYPRFSNAKTEQSLLVKQQGINIMSGILKEKGFFGNLSKKEYMRGNREYIRQVQIYWSKHKMLFANEEEIIAKIEEDDSKDDE